MQPMMPYKLHDCNEHVASLATGTSRTMPNQGQFKKHPTMGFVHEADLSLEKARE